MSLSTKMMQGLVVGLAGALGVWIHQRYVANHATYIPVDIRQAKGRGDRLGVDWDRVRLPQFRRGLEVEQEHWQTVKGDWDQIAQIALDHLQGEGGLEDYYDRLDRMEEEAGS